MLRLLLSSIFLFCMGCNSIERKGFVDPLIGVLDVQEGRYLDYGSDKICDQAHEKVVLNLDRHLKSENKLNTFQYANPKSMSCVFRNYGYDIVLPIQTAVDRPETRLGLITARLDVELNLLAWQFVR